MFKVGEKVVCVNINDIDVSYGLKIGLIYNVFESIKYTEYIMIEEDKHHVYYTYSFISLKEHRKQKLDKICSK